MAWPACTRAPRRAAGPASARRQTPWLRPAAAAASSLCAPKLVVDSSRPSTQGLIERHIAAELPRCLRPRRRPLRRLLRSPRRSQRRQLVSFPHVLFGAVTVGLVLLFSSSALNSASSTSAFAVHFVALVCIHFFFIFFSAPSASSSSSQLPLRPLCGVLCPLLTSFFGAKIFGAKL